jgi:hypothetical protein
LNRRHEPRLSDRLLLVVRLKPPHDDREGALDEVGAEGQREADAHRHRQHPLPDGDAVKGRIAPPSNGACFTP